VVPRGRIALAYPRGDVFDEGPQRVRIGRRGEGEHAEAEVQRELVRTSAPVVGRSDDRLVAVAGGRGRRRRVKAPGTL
jgi:hypothetical protein